MEFAVSFAGRRSTKQRDRFPKFLASSLAPRLKDHDGQLPANEEESRQRCPATFKREQPVRDKLSSLRGKKELGVIMPF